MINLSKSTVGGLIALIALFAYLYIPPPHPARAQFLDQSTYGGTSGGSANAQTITIANYSAHIPGVVIRFIPGFVNTGPTTINISGIGAVALLRPSSIGNAFLSGGELQTGELTCITYNGAAYQLSCNVDMTPIGRTVEYRGAAIPRGTLIEDGSCVSRTTYAPLFSVIGTTYGACDGSTTFGVPDSRGTVFAALDNQGANGSANRITTGGSGCNGTTNGLFCGTQSYTMLTANLPPYTPIGSSSITSFDHTTANSVCQVGAGVAVTDANTLTRSSFQPQGGTSTPFAILNPLVLGRRAIKY
jgi:microcystin-dependent protein